MGGIVEVTATRFIGNSVQALSARRTVGHSSGGGGMMLYGTSSCKISATQFESNQLLANSTGIVYSTATVADVSGGGLYIGDASCDLSSVTFSANRIRSYRGTISHVDARGGAAYFRSSFARRVRLDGCKFVRNTISVNRGGGYGGAVGVLNVTLTVRDSLFSANAVNVSASQGMHAQVLGGAIYYEGASLDVEGTEFTSNLVTFAAVNPQYVEVAGGAVYAYGVSGSGYASVLYTFRSSRFASNQASLLRSGTASPMNVEAHGGGIRAQAQVKGNLNVTACVFVKNSIYLKATTTNEWGAGGTWLDSSTVCATGKQCQLMHHTILLADIA